MEEKKKWGRVEGKARQRKEATAQRQNRVIMMTGGVGLEKKRKKKRTTLLQNFVNGQNV